MKGSTTRWLAHGSFWLATLGIVLMGWTLYRASSNEAESARQVGHSQNVRQKLVGIEALIERTESLQRGYLLSAVEVFPVERDQAFAKLEKTITSVHKLTLEHPLQQQRLEELRTAVRARQNTMRELEHLRRSGTLAASGINAAAEAGLVARTQLLAVTRALKKAEYSALRAHRQTAAYRHDTELGVLVAGSLFGLVVLIPGYLGFVLQSQARAQTEQRLQLMADSLPGAMYQLKHRRRGPPHMVFMSAAVRSISRHPRPDWNTLLGDIDAPDQAGFQFALAQSLQTLAPLRHSYRVVHADGSSQFLCHEASLHRQSDGSVLQNGYIADVSGQRQLESALVAARETADLANSAKSAFLATMSHEIRTPMNGALGMLELLSLTPLDVEQRTCLSIVRESSSSLLRLIDDILDFSMMEADKLEIRPEVVAIAEVIEDVRDIYSGVASRKGLSIRRSTDPRISPALRVDPLRLRQILNNLVSNALKFTTVGHVEINAEWIAREQGEDQIRFSVSDTGIGISLENQRRLFQAFSRGDAPTQLVPGSGLGLTICRRLASLMGGTIEMVSQPGSGTTMILNLSLPIADPALLPDRDTQRAHEHLLHITRVRQQAVRKGATVLIVDDHPTNRTLLLRQAHTLGYAAESAENGVEALARWQARPFDLVITDCNMPELDGYQLARAIRVIESRTGAVRVPIIGCTANALAGQIERCLAAGMDDCLVKPVDLAKLLHKLEQWLPADADAVAETEVAPQPDAAVDRTLLAEISGGNTVIEHQILSAFCDANDHDAAALACAVLAHDPSKLTRTAHSMSGAARMIGAIRLAEVCERIEHAGRARDWTAITLDMGLLQQERLCLDRWLVATQTMKLLSKELECRVPSCDS